MSDQANPVSQNSFDHATNKSHTLGNMATGHFDLLRSFTLLSLLTIIFITSISAILLTEFVTRSMLQEEANVTREFIQSAAGTERLPDRPYQTDFLNNKRWLAGYLQRIGRLPNTPLVKIYAPDQSIIWATDHTLIGEKFSDNQELIAALNGELIYKQEEMDELDSENDKTDLTYFSETLDQVIEIYIPLWDTDHTQVIAVVELYKTPESLFEAMYQVKLYIWLGAAIGGALLFVVLFSIVRRANNTLKRQRLAIVESEALATIGEMTSAMAHGIRNPLASIRSSAELSLLTPEHSERMSENIIISVDRLQEWINDFIQFSETETHFNSQTVVFDRLIEESLELFKEQANSQHITIELLPFEIYAPVVGDPALLRQLIAIILDNSIEAMPQGGIITVRQVRHDDHHIRLEITDNGIGIPQSQIKSVFKPFTTNKKHALGLGLMMAQRIAYHHSGHVELSSQEGQGTTVSIILPALIRSHFKVLVIDNEVTFSQNLKSYLEQYEFEVSICEPGEESLHLISNWKPDFILTESKLSDMDAITMCKEMLKRHSKAQIVILSGQVNSETDRENSNTHQLLQAGARAVLTKPIPLANIRTQLEILKAPHSHG